MSNEERSLTAATEEKPFLALSSENLPATLRTERQIKARLVMRGISQKDIAMQHGLHPSDVSRVIKGDRKSRKIRNIIAQELEVEYEMLWGQSA